jgi:predicted small lipoprotein YifL
VTRPALVLLASVLLAACGQKGPLVRPPPVRATPVAAPAPAAEVPPAQAAPKRDPAATADDAPRP